MRVMFPKKTIAVHDLPKLQPQATLDVSPITHSFARCVGLVGRLGLGRAHVRMDSSRLYSELPVPLEEQPFKILKRVSMFSAASLFPGIKSRARRVERRLQPLQMHRNTLRGIWSGRTSRLHATSRMYAAFQAATLPLQMPRKEIWSARAGSWSRFKCYGK